jgi:hypothetical protein
MVVSVAVNAGAIPGGEVERTVVAYAVKFVDIGCEWPDAHSRDLLQAPDDRVDFRWGKDWNWAVHKCARPLLGRRARLRRDSYDRGPGVKCSMRAIRRRQSQTRELRALPDRIRAKYA